MIERVSRAAERADTGGNYFTRPASDVRFFSSGSKLLDLALGGGWAEGRILNIIGDRSTGKTLLCIEAAANFILKYPRGKVFYREAESAFNIPYAEALGMPIHKVEFGEGPIGTVEELFNELDEITKAETKSDVLYILDSLDALSDKDEQAREIDKGSFGAGKAKKMSELFRRRIRAIEEAGMTMIIVSQMRDNIGATFGRQWVRTGGRALDFYASQVIVLAQLMKLMREITRRGVKISRPVGLQIKALVDKNKVGLPLREAEFPIMFGFGVDDVTSCLDWAKKVGIMDKVLTDIALDTKEAVFKKMLREQHRPEIVEKLHALVAETWYDIEKEFLPPRRKYGIWEE